MTRSKYLNNSLRLSERHKGDLPQDITVFDKGRLFPNKAKLLRNKAGLLQKL